MASTIRISDENRRRETKSHASTIRPSAFLTRSRNVIAPRRRLIELANLRDRALWVVAVRAHAVRHFGSRRAVLPERRFELGSVAKDAALQVRAAGLSNETRGCSHHYFLELR